MTLGQKIKEARRQAGFTQEQLAEKLSVSRAAVAKWETDKGMPDVENLKELAKRLGVSVDYMLDDEEDKELLEFREAIKLEEYEKSGKCRCREDAVVIAKYPQADAIIPLIRRKKLSKAEWILDFLTVPGVFAAADSINNRAEHYLVEQGERQFLVSVTKEFITSVRLARRVTENKFDVGQNRFIKAAYSLHNKQ